MPSFTIQVTSLVNGSKSDVWDSISSFKGVNRELSPFLQMTCPEPNTKLSKSMESHDTPLFTSWLLLFGFLPVEYDCLRLENVTEGEGFKERSSMLMMSEWHHDRTLISENVNETLRTRVIDVISFTPRLYILGWIMVYIVRFLFHHRHVNLRRQFGTSDMRINISSSNNHYS